jgi:hypothetical protein
MKISIGHRTQILTSAWGTYAPHMHNLTQLVTNGLIEGMRAKRAQVPMLPDTVAKGVCAPPDRPPPHPSTYWKTPRASFVRCMSREAFACKASRQRYM